MSTSIHNMRINELCGEILHTAIKPGLKFAISSYCHSQSGQPYIKTCWLERFSVVELCIFIHFVRSQISWLLQSAATFPTESTHRTMEWNHGYSKKQVRRSKKVHRTPWSFEFLIQNFKVSNGPFQYLVRSFHFSETGPNKKSKISFMVRCVVSVRSAGCALQQSTTLGHWMADQTEWIKIHYRKSFQTASFYVKLSWLALTIWQYWKYM